MCNSVSKAEWEPLGFEDLSDWKVRALSDGENQVISEEIISAALEIDNEVAFEIQRANVIAQAEEKGYQDGLALGKEHGFQTGYEAGQKQGYEEGQTHIEQELAGQIQQQKMIALETITQLVANFQYAVQQLEGKVVPKLVSLALTASEKMVGKITKSDQKQLTLIVQELVNQYPPLGEDIQLYVNPNDVTSIEKMLKDELEKYGWRVIVDPNMESGGCLILSEKVEIDATVPSRWQNLTSVLQKGSE